MFTLNDDFDSEEILKKCTIQNVVLEQTEHEKVEKKQLYEEALNSYKEAKKEFYERQITHQDLNAAIVESSQIKNAFYELQSIPNTKVQEIQSEILRAYHEMSSDSDNFVKLVNITVNQFQNLGNEFDQNTMQTQIIESAETEKQLQIQVHNHRIKFESMRNFWNQYKHDYDEINFGQSYIDETTRLEKEIFAKKCHLTLVRKNIEFLKKEMANKDKIK